MGSSPVFNIYKAYSLIWQKRSAHNGFIIGSSPIKLNETKFNKTNFLEDQGLYKA